MIPIRAILSVVVLATIASAQTNVGIYISRGISTISGVRCGFDCNDPTNVWPVQAQVLDTIDVRVTGDVNRPGWCAVGIGPAYQPCPGFRIPGISNSLLMVPSNVVFVAGGTALGPYRTGPCGDGVALVLAGLQLPIAASGGVVTFQGIVFSLGAPAFTRALELSIL